MWIDDDEFIIRCGCGDIDHCTHLYFSLGHFDDIPYAEIDIYQRPDSGPLWTRIKNAMLYIFKSQRFWHYGDTLMRLDNPKQRAEVAELAEFLRSCVAQAEKPKSL